MMLCLGLLTLGVQAQVTIVDGHYVDTKQGKEANPTSNPDYSLVHGAIVKKATQTKGRAPIAPAVNYGLPDHVNNGANKYFRSPIANQAGNSCGITSRFAHMMAYELNAYRDKDGSLAENMLPPHFAFVPAYKEDPNKENYAKYIGVPDGVTFGGTNVSSIYGGPYSESSNNYGRMQGYENWHKAMFNRITDNPNFPTYTLTEAGALAWKRWLYNHNGDENFHAGGVIGIGCASNGMEQQEIGSTTANDAAGVTGLNYLKHWGTGVDHAMAIVGYDDRIEFDLDGNGTYGETSNAFGQNETGAWIAANSWGSGWGNNGFIYVPYALASATSTAVTSGSYSGYKAGDNSGWNGEIYKIRKAYTPIRTLKAAVAYSKRSEIEICVGISTNLNASSPDKTMVLKNHSYHGDYDGDGTDAEVPMLGRWTDGKLHTEAMEFGYDLTDFTDEFDRHVPLKYFLIINSKSGASGSGKIEYASIMDYELNPNGIETPFASKNVSISNNGGTTTISTVVYGEEVSGPDNLTLSSNTLSWDAPRSSGYTPSVYYIYQDGERIGSSNTTSYNIGSATGVFYVTAGLYEVDGAIAESPASNNVLRNMSSSSFISYIKDPISATSELTSNMYVMLYNYGRGKYMYDNGAGAIYLFTGGEPKVIDPDYYKYVFKVTKSSNKYTFTSINGEIPAISNNNQTLTPSNTAGAYTVSKVDGSDNLFTLYSNTYLNGTDSNPVGWSSGTDNTSKWMIIPVNVSIPSVNTLSVTIKDPGNVYAGIPVQLQLEGAADLASATWTVDGTNYTGVSPFVTFNSTGSKTVSCTATDSKGNSANTSKAITVSSAPAVTANFTLSSESTTGSDRISFLSANTIPGCTYSWSMPGAEETTATTRNASATYLTTGQKTVTLTVTDANNNSVSHSETFMVNASAPKSRYSISPAVVVKNNPVTLTDNSLYAPTSWNWLFESDYNRITCNTQDGTITPTKAGVYKLTYRTENALGYDELEAKRALIVCNSASYTGLTFAGGDQNVTASMSSALTTAWTIDFWFNPKSLGTTTQGITGSNSNSFTITSDASGVATLTVGSQSVTSDKAFYISNEWHHYAITFSSGTVTFYRDGSVVSTKSISTTTFSSYFQNLKLGGSAAPMNGSIDEFRVWNKALTQANIRSYCIAPISASTSGLKLYWQMNQSTGNVTDATSNKVTGTRNNFGPDGDAWTDSDGVFALDFPASNFDNVDLKVAASPATDLSTGTWYVMSNHGRGGYLYESNSNILNNTSNKPGSGSGDSYRYLVCLSNADNGKFYIETGNGNYIQALSRSQDVTTGAAKEAFTIEAVNSTAGHFYVQGCSNDVVLDSNEPGSTIVGYGTTVPTATGGNNCWHFYPVEFIEEADVKIVYGTNGETTYGSWSDNTWTSNAESGMAGVTLTLSDGSHDKFSSLNNRYNLAYHPESANTDATLTLTAPDGYVITGYSAESGVYQENCYTVTPSGGTAITPANLGSTYTTLSASGLSAASTTIKVNTTDASRWLALANFVVSIALESSILEGVIKMAASPANDLETGRWYVMYNRGSYRNYLYENESNQLYNTTSDGHPGLVRSDAKRFLVRLSDAGSGKYYIETGRGNYVQALSTSNGTVATTGTTKETFTIAKINSTDGHFYVQGANNVILDCSAAVSNDAGVVSWGTTVPTSTGSNNDWAFYPIEFVESIFTSETDIFTINNTNSSRGALMSAPSQSEKWLWSSGKNGQTFSTTDTNCQWMIVHTGTDGQYYIYNVGKQKFIVPTKSGSYGGYSWMFSSDAVPVQFFLQSDGTYKMNTVSGNIYISVSNSYTGPIINYNDAGAQFTISKQGTATSEISTQLSAAVAAKPNATKQMALNKVGGKSYATLYLDYDAQTDANTKAYYITEVAGGYAKMTELTNQEIPAYTAVVLVNESGDTEVDFSTGFSVSNGYAKVVEENENLLKGTLTPMELDLSQSSPYYSLGVIDKIGFYKFYNGNSTTITLGANKAYLEYTAPVGVKGFVLDFGGEDGIEQMVNHTSADRKWYDLNGRRLHGTPTAKGIYIIDGKKVVVK